MAKRLVDEARDDMTRARSMAATTKELGAWLHVLVIVTTNKESNSNGFCMLYMYNKVTNKAIKRHTATRDPIVAPAMIAAVKGKEEVGIAQLITGNMWY